MISRDRTATCQVGMDIFRKTEGTPGYQAMLEACHQALLRAIGEVKDASAFAKAAGGAGNALMCTVGLDESKENILKNWMLATLAKATKGGTEPVSVELRPLYDKWLDRCNNVLRCR